MTKIIKTNIKFLQGLNGDPNKLYGFITKVKGSWRGCREDIEKKKLVFPDKKIAGNIIPNALYKCTLIPMKQEQGFIAKTAKIIKFRASVVTICNDDQYQVEVRFGNRRIIYNPESTDQSRNDIQTIANHLRGRQDLENSYLVAEDFIDSAFMVKHIFNQTRYVH